MMEGVVEHGTATNLKNANYKIAGKTGTAQIAREKSDTEQTKAFPTRLHLSDTFRLKTLSIHALLLLILLQTAFISVTLSQVLFLRRFLIKFMQRTSSGIIKLIMMMEDRCP